MEVIGYIVCFVIGGIATAVPFIINRPRPIVAEKKSEEKADEVPQRLRIQYENFMNYDGTGRGQKKIEDQ